MTLLVDKQIIICEKCVIKILLNYHTTSLACKRNAKYDKKRVLDYFLHIMKYIVMIISTINLTLNRTLFSSIVIL